jgi:3-hydroxyethyl bacteriochlorophyllide a dehydrogenase
MSAVVQGGHAAPAPMTASGETARAVVFTDPGKLDMRTLHLREPAPDEATVDTHFSSISAGTERLIFGGKLPGFPQLRFPLVPGYEAAGIVSSVGSAVSNVRVGDEVFVGGSMCYVDASGVFGGQSSRLIKKASQLVALEGIPLVQAPLLALAATSLHGVRRLGDVAGKTVVVLGMGAIGALAARFLNVAGARVICADTRPERLDPALGEQLDLSGGAALETLVRDADAVIEATGISRMIAACARACQPGGKIVLLSYYDELVTPYVDCFVKEVDLLVAREWSHPDLLAARDAIAAGSIDVRSLAEHVVPVDAYERAYRTAFEDPSVLKVILQWV